MGEYKAFISLRLSILNTLFFLPFRKPLTYGKKLKMLKVLTFGIFDSLLSILIPLSTSL